jgi:leader peptidase (prepilin peptidase)/N-methyltransferase
VGWRGPIIESLTAALIALLFFLYIGSRKPYATWAGQLGYDHSKLVALFVYHSLLVCFLIVATFIDLEYWIIPDSVTIPGMLVGVFLGTFWYVELHPLLVMRTPEQSPASLISETTWARLFGRSDSGLVYESIFSAINAHWNLNWNRWIGFMTGMTGLVAGGLLVWVVRAICSWAFQAEAIGFGDVTLMAMVGGFLGWQLVIVAFFLAPLSAVVVGLFGLVLAGWRAIPYGPHLSIGTLFTVLFLRELSPFIWAIERDTTFIIIAAVFMLVLLAIVAVTVQWCKRFLIRVR